MISESVEGGGTLSEHLMAHEAGRSLVSFLNQASWLNSVKEVEASVDV